MMFLEGTKKNVREKHFSFAILPITSIYISISFLSVNQGNMILVDTPGIGGSGNVKDKLIEYLPNALLFIFVINAGSAGGMQNDRVDIYEFYCR